MINIIMMIYLSITLACLILSKILNTELSKSNYSKEIFAIYFDDEELINEAIWCMKTPSLGDIAKCFIPIYNLYMMVFTLLSIIYLKKNPDVIKNVVEELKEEETIQRMKEHYDKKQ